jgi:ATP-binding cassette subfamily B protein
MSVKKGQKIAIIGANGAGKTTLVKLLLRLYDPQSGTVSVNGTSYTDISTEDIRNLAGAVFQNPEVYSVTIGENVLLRKPKTVEDENLIVEALKFSGLYDYVSSLDEGINTLVTREFHRQGEIFSGGQMQKLAIARGYAQNYQLFILDEPSSALDPIAEADLYHNMLELGRDRTMVFISHRLSSTANADYIYLIDNGKIEESGTHEELMALRGKYYEMFISQSEKYLGGEENDKVFA